MSFIQYGFSTPIVASGEVVTVGDIVCVLPADPYKFYVATAANMALATTWAGVSLDDATEDNPFRIQTEGLVGHDVTGLGAGTAGACYVSTTGRFTRTVTSYQVGYVNTIGDVFLNRANATGGIPSVGAADTVFQTNSAATATEWEKIFNANVADNAGIVGSSGGQHKIVPTYGAQNVSFTGYAEIGPTPVATTGSIRVANNTTIIAARNAADSGNIPVIRTDSLDNIIIGDSTTAETADFNALTTVDAYTPQFILRDAAGVDAMVATSNPTGASAFTFAQNTTATITQTTTGSATGAPLTIAAQQAATTGGTLVLSGGAGSTEANRGKIELVGPIAGSVANTLPMRMGVSSISYTADANKTLTAAEYSNPVLIVTSTLSLTGTRDMIVPLHNGSTWFVVNNTTGGQSIRIIGATGTGITIGSGESTAVTSNGTNIITLVRGPAGAAGATGATGATGAAGTNATRYVQTFTASGTFTPSANVNALDYVIIVGAGGGSGGGGGGGGGASGGSGGGGGGGGSAPGNPGSYACFANYDVTPSVGITVTVGAGGTAGSAGSGGASDTAGSNGGAGGTGGVSAFGSVRVNGGSGSAGGSGGAAGNGTRAGGAAGASGTAGDGCAGGAGSAAGTGTDGNISITATCNAIPLYGTTWQSIGFLGTMNGNTGANGGTGGAAGGGGGGGGGGACVGNSSGLRPMFLPQMGATVNCQSPGTGGNGGTTTVNGSAGNAPSGTQTYGTGACGASGGGGGGNGTTTGGNGSAGAVGGQGLVIVSWTDPSSQI